MIPRRSVNCLRHGSSASRNICKSLSFGSLRSDFATAEFFLASFLPFSDDSPRPPLQNPPGQGGREVVSTELGPVSFYLACSRPTIHDDHSKPDRLAGSRPVFSRVVGKCEARRYRSQCSRKEIVIKPGLKPPASAPKEEGPDNP